MGSDRKWIYLSYVVGVLILSWVMDQALKLIIGYVRVPNPIVMGVLPASSIVSILSIGLFAYFYCRQEKVMAFSMEVVQELQKVTWPAKKNSYMSTVVVVVSVIVMAVILGIFDWVCTHVVSFVLRV